jgi:hypothetical protein
MPDADLDALAAAAFARGLIQLTLSRTSTMYQAGARYRGGSGWLVWIEETPSAAIRGVLAQVPGLAPAAPEPSIFD